MARRRRSAGLLILAALMGATFAPATATAGSPPSAASIKGQPENDTQTTVKTPEQQAKVDAKVAVANEVAEAIVGSTPEIGPSMPEPLPNPPSSKVLATNARQQYTSYYCGPASAQVAINWSRGYGSTALGGERTDTNWKKQSTIANWANTTSSSGTSGAKLETALNRSDAVLPPSSIWIYDYAATGDETGLHNKVVSDVWSFEMPLVFPVRPHQPDKNYHLASWPNAIDAWHWILIRGYNGLTPSSATLYYNDSAAGYWGGTGAYQDTVETMWKVNHFSSDMVIW